MPLWQRAQGEAVLLAAAAVAGTEHIRVPCPEPDIAAASMAVAPDMLDDEHSEEQARLHRAQLSLIRLLC